MNEGLEDTKYHLYVNERCSLDIRKSINSLKGLCYINGAEYYKHTPERKDAHIIKRLDRFSIELSLYVIN